LVPDPPTSASSSSSAAAVAKAVRCFQGGYKCSGGSAVYLGAAERTLGLLLLRALLAASLDDGGCSEPEPRSQPTGSQPTATSWARPPRLPPLILVECSSGTGSLDMEVETVLVVCRQLEEALGRGEGIMGGDFFSSSHCG
jgi:hypothetical protein